MGYRFKCEGCNKPLKGYCWYRRTCTTKALLGLEPYKQVTEYYCDKCARAQIDDHNTNGLMLTYIQEAADK